MKNIFKLAAIAVVAMSLAVACKGNKAEEPAEDTMPVEEIVMDTIDSVEMVAEEVIPEEPVKTTAKKVTKKEENKVSDVVVAPVAEKGAKAGVKKTKEVKSEEKIENTNAPTSLPSAGGKVRK